MKWARRFEPYMREIADPYAYPDSGVLHNLPDIRDRADLEVFEADTTIQRMAELHASPVGGPFNSAHLKAIHKIGRAHV